MSTNMKNKTKAYKLETCNKHPNCQERRCQECNNYRSISYASKVMTKALQQSLLPYMKQKMLDFKARFRKGRGNWDLIVNTYWALQCSKECQNKNTTLCFRLKTLTAWIMKSFGLPWKKWTWLITWLFDA